MFKLMANAPGGCFRINHCLLSRCCNKTLRCVKMPSNMYQSIRRIIL